MTKNIFRLSGGIIRKQRIYYSLLALFFTLVLALSPVFHLSVAAQASTPVLSLSASCTPDAQGSFVITNIGSNMTGPGTWTLLLNGTPIASNSFQLNAGAIHEHQYQRPLRDTGIRYFRRRSSSSHRVHLLPVADGYAHACPADYIAFGQLHPGRPGGVHDLQHRFEYDRARHMDLTAERHSHRQQQLSIECERIHEHQYQRPLRDTGIGHFRRRSSSSQRLHLLPVADGYAHACPADYIAIGQLHPGRPGIVRDLQHRFEHDRPGYMDFTVERHSHRQQ